MICASRSGVTIPRKLVSADFLTAYSRSHLHSVRPRESICRIQDDLVRLRGPACLLRSAHDDCDVWFISNSPRMRNNHRRVSRWRSSRLVAPNLPSLHSSGGEIGTLVMADSNASHSLSRLKAALTSSGVSGFSGVGHN